MNRLIAGFLVGLAIGATTITIARAHTPAVLWWLFSQGDT